VGPGARLALASHSRSEGIQIGLSGEAVERYVNQWTVRIEDVTAVARMVAASVESGHPPSPLPSASERPYPLEAAKVAAICPH
jgi:hypothetical protein